MGVRWGWRHPLRHGVSMDSPIPSGAPAEELDDLEWNVLKPSRLSAVYITCQHFRYEDRSPREVRLAAR